MLVDWRRVRGRGVKTTANSQLKLIFGANLNILVSSVTLYGRAENNLPKSFIARPKQLQGFTGFKTEIQVRNVLNFLIWTVYIWKKFRLKRLNLLRYEHILKTLHRKEAFFGTEVLHHIYKENKKCS